MSVVLVTGSAGLIGAESVRFFAAQGFDIVGIDNDMRRRLLRQRGEHARGAGSGSKSRSRPIATSTATSATRTLMDKIFARYGDDVAAVIHTAAQPSHDWAAGDPQTDFTVNANGTLNLWRRRAGTARRRRSSSPAPTRSMATRPISCR